MTIDFLPSTHLTPGSSFSFTFTRASQGLIPLARSIALVGMQSRSQAEVDVPVRVHSPDQAAELFGPGCELSLMIDAAFATGALFGQMPQVYAVPLAPPSGGVAAAHQLALSGMATHSGRALIRIAGVSVQAPVSAGDDSTDIAQALRVAMDALTRKLPVAAGGTGGTVAATHKTAGENGNDVVIDVVEMPAGITYTLDHTDGAGKASIDVALDHLLALDIDGVAIANHTVEDVQALSDHAALAWQPDRKRWRHVFAATTGDNSTAGALAAIDRYWAIVGACRGSASTPGQIAAALAAIAFATGSPAYNLQGYDRLPLYAPRTSDRYSPIDVEELLQLGVTPLEAVASRPDRLAITRLVTTQRTLSGTPSLQLADASVTLTSAYMARQLDAAYRRAFGPDSGNPRTITAEQIDQVRDVIIATLRAGERAGYVRNLDARLPELRVTESDIAPGRLLATVPLEPTPQLMQLAFSMNVYS